MNKIEVINILEKIRDSLSLGYIDLSRDLIQLEIDNLKNNNEHKCINNKYYFESYCKNCSNKECVNNKKFY